MLEGQGTKLGTVQTEATLTHATGQFLWKLHTCDVRDYSGWLQKKKKKCLLQGIWCPHIQQQLHLIHGCLPCLIYEPPLGIPQPSSETLAITGQILGFRKAGEQMFSEPDCRVGIQVWRKHVSLQDLCGPQHWSLASSYSISVCHACWSVLKTSQKPAQPAPLACLLALLL